MPKCSWVHTLCFVFINNVGQSVCEARDSGRCRRNIARCWRCWRGAVHSSRSVPLFTKYTGKERLIANSNTLASFGPLKRLNLASMCGGSMFVSFGHVSKSRQYMRRSILAVISIYSGMLVCISLQVHGKKTVVMNPGSFGVSCVAFVVHD